MDPKIESSSTDVINLTWTKPEGDMTGYRIDYQPIQDSEAASGDDQDKPIGDDAEGQDKPSDDQDKPEDVGQDGVAEGQDKPSNEEEKADVLDVLSEDKETSNQDKPNGSEIQEDENQDKPVDDENAESKSTSVEGGETTKAEITGLVPGQSYQFHIITMSGEVGSEPVTIKGATSKYTF